MKCAVLLAIVAAVAGAQAAVVRSDGPIVPDTAIFLNPNLSIGTPGPDDIIISRWEMISENRGAGHTWYGENVEVTAIRAEENGKNRFAKIELFFGGVGEDHVSLIASPRLGKGFHYSVTVWGREV